VHLPALRACPSTEPVALWHPRQERLDQACRQCGLAGSSDFDSLLADPRVEAVVIDPPRGFRLGDGEAMVEAACADAGIVQVPHYMAEDAIAAGRLREVLRPFRPAPTPISVVYPGSRLMAPRLRAFLDAFDAQRHPEHGKPR
jgi:DNA-binding transcriptional LysR family regulator